MGLREFCTSVIHRLRTLSWILFTSNKACNIGPITTWDDPVLGKGRLFLTSLRSKPLAHHFWWSNSVIQLSNGYPTYCTQDFFNPYLVPLQTTCCRSWRPWLENSCQGQEHLLCLRDSHKGCIATSLCVRLCLEILTCTPQDTFILKGGLRSGNVTYLHTYLATADSAVCLNQN